MVASRKAWRSRSGRRSGQIDLDVELAQGLEQGKVIHFLVDAAVLAFGKPAAGDGYDRSAGQIGVAQPCRQVGRADGLGHGHPGPPRDSSVAVGHVDGRLLAVGRDPHDIEAFHFGPGPGVRMVGTRKTWVIS